MDRFQVLKTAKWTPSGAVEAFSRLLISGVNQPTGIGGPTISIRTLPGHKGSLTYLEHLTGNGFADSLRDLGGVRGLRVRPSITS